MRRKLIAVLLGMTLAMGSLTGCGGSEATAATKTADGKVEIEFWYAGGKTAAGILEEIVQEFNASQDAYEVKTTTQADYSETYEKLQAAIAGKKAPDMVLLGVPDARNLSAKGLLTDLQPMMDADETFEQEDYLEVFFDQGISEEAGTYAIPAYGTTQVMYYNLEAFATAGIDPESITTWQDLAAAAETMTTADGSFVGWEPMWGMWNLVDASLSNGAQLISEDGTEVLINSPEWVEVWESMRGWIHDDEIMKVNSGGQGWEYWYTTMDDVLQGRAGGYTGSSGDQADLDFDIVGAMEQPGFGDHPSAPAADALQFTMLDSASEEEKEGVFELMKFFTSAESQATWSMGTGYVPVRKSTVDVEAYANYTAENPHALVPFNQASHGTPALIDPTGGKIFDALSIAADQVELENISAQEALDQAQEVAQEALDSL